MKVRQPDRTPSGASRSRLYDDGYQDGKLGRAILSDQLFESRVDYQIYKSGYDDAIASKKSTRKLDSNFFGIQLDQRDSPFIEASGIWWGGSGVGYYIKSGE